MIKVRFIKAWRFYSVGDIIEPTGTLREVLTRGGFVVPLELPQIETATAEPVAEQAVTRRNRRR